MNDARLLPISILGLDLPAPAAGWPAELERRQITVIVDELGRPSISWGDARQLFADHLENEARRNRHRLQMEQQAVEADQRRLASLPRGVPAGAVPDGMSAGLLMMASDPIPGEPRRRSLLEESLDNSGTLTYHPIQDES